VPTLFDELNLVVRDDEASKHEASRHHPAELALAPSNEQLRQASRHGAGDSTR
jgi:hypothetical protein